MATRADRTAPIGIKILCFLTAISLPRRISAGFEIMDRASEMGAERVVVFLGLVVVALAVAKLFMIIGLLTLAPWGWRAAMYIYGIEGLLGILAILSGSAAGIFGLVSFLILGYIYSRKSHYVVTDPTPDTHNTQKGQTNTGAHHGVKSETPNAVTANQQTKAKTAQTKAKTAQTNAKTAQTSYYCKKCGATYDDNYRNCPACRSERVVAEGDPVA